MADDRSEWTPEELVAELRARERARVGAPASGGRSFEEGAAAAPKGTATGVVPRFRRLDEIPSSELAKRAADLQRSIYGVDDRKETYEIKEARARALIDASLALVERADLQETADGQWTLRTSSYKREYNLCSSETFAAQPLGCFCSGVLVAPDIVATAGHCVKGNADLDHIRFVFGFHMVDGDTPRTTFPADDVYRGKEVIGRRYTPDRTDWALVRLDRVVVDRKPVAFRAEGKVKSDEPVFVIGHPCGLPQKIARGARVRSNSAASYFVANLDTYGGNSGSPVFSAKSYRLEGLLVRGQTDFVSTGSCYVSMAYPTTGAGGEDVSRTTEWTAAMPKRAGTTGAAKKAKGARTSLPKAARKTTPARKSAGRKR
jgi:hypothetical protein